MKKEFSDFDITVETLTADLDLYKPNFERSIAGVLPELIRGLNTDKPGNVITDCVENLNVRKMINESFPSGYDNIVFLICDAVGVVHLQNMGGLLWDNITNKGTIATTVFPSMTSTVMTSLSYGKFPSSHGLLGYNIYNEHLDDIWNPLNLQYIKNGEQRFVLEDVTKDKLVDGFPIIDRLVDSLEFPVTFIGPSEYYGQPSLLDLLNYNTPVTIYDSPMDAGIKLSNALNQDHNNQLVAIYIGYADYAAHGYGPDSEQYIQAIRGIEQAITMIEQLPKVKNGSTLVVMTSDHGQVQIDHSISHWMEKKQWNAYKDKGITLSTSGRVLHAYCNEDKKDDGKNLLENLANGRGLVIDRNQAMDLAGGVLNHTKRMGDYLMVMEDNYLYDVPEVVKFGPDIKLNGQHGSLTPKELFVPVGIFGNGKA